MKKKFYILIIILLILLITCKVNDKNILNEKNTNSNNYYFNSVQPSELGLKNDDFINLDKIIKNEYQNINSLIILKNGKMLFEKYYNGTDVNTYDNIYSITKSVISAVVGICMEKKILTNLDKKIIDYLPEYFKGDIEKTKENITIKNMLTMTSGLESTDNNYYKWFSSDDWILYTLNNKLIKTPGSQFIYDTGTTHILSAIVTKATGKSTYDFTKEFLFDPLNIQIKNWDKDPKGYYCGGTGLYLTPRDLLKFGYLYLNNGVWEGKQIVPVEWVKESTSSQIKVDLLQEYGYLWWKKNPGYTEAGSDSIFVAVGYGSQFIFIYPDKNLVIVITSNPEKTFAKKINSDKIIYEQILKIL